MNVLQLFKKSIETTDVIFKLLIDIKTSRVPEMFMFNLIDKLEKLKILLSYPNKN